MFASTANAQTTGGASGPAPGGGPADFLGPFLLPIALLALFYVMVLRPQQRRQKQQQASIAGIKRGDTVVMTSGLIGKVTRVDDAELQVEIAPTVNVKVVKAMVSEVRGRGEPVAVANDAKG